MADSGDLEKKLMRLKKEGLKVEARNRNLAESGTKAELVRYLTFQSKLLLGSVINELYEMKQTKKLKILKKNQKTKNMEQNEINAIGANYFKTSPGIKKIKICLF